jgi:hypothetical protein
LRSALVLVVLFLAAPGALDVLTVLLLFEIVLFNECTIGLRRIQSFNSLITASAAPRGSIVDSDRLQAAIYDHMIIPVGTGDDVHLQLAQLRFEQEWHARVHTHRGLFLIRERGQFQALDDRRAVRARGADQRRRAMADGRYQLTMRGEMPDRVRHRVTLRQIVHDAVPARKQYGVEFRHILALQVTRIPQGLQRFLIERDVWILGHALRVDWDRPSPRARHRDTIASTTKLAGKARRTPPTTSRCGDHRRYDRVGLPPS